MVVSARKSRNGDRINVGPAALSDILKVLARHNPKVSQVALEATGKAVAAVSAATAALSQEQQRNIVVRDEELAIAVKTALSKLAEEHSGPVVDLIQLAVKKPVEVSVGAGLGKVVELDVGRLHLSDYATAERLEDWAGAVAGPGEIEKRFGTKRSTLHDWQRRGAIIGLLKGERKHVFPLAQFLDGRPLEGMSEVTKIIGNPRAAWQWLIGSKPSIGGTPLNALKAGRISEVVEAAKRDFA